MSQMSVANRLQRLSFGELRQASAGPFAGRQHWLADRRTGRKHPSSERPPPSLTGGSSAKPETNRITPA